MVLLRAIRIHQWVKNLILFVPMITAHRFTDSALFMHALVAFFSFGMCASAVYLINDLVDLESDRQHEHKRNRPLASGAMSVNQALILIPLLLMLGIFLGYLVSINYLLVSVLYFLTTLGYSFLFKQIVLVDIIVLAILYTIRVVAGGIATNLEVSQWLIGFSLFFFVSLACIKRFSELFNQRKREQSEIKGRGYIVGDLELISQFGIASGCVAVLVLALYITSADVTVIYSSPRMLWIMCPMLMYWISRLWLIAHRGLVHDDPIVFAIKDRVSYVVGFLSLVLLLLAA